MESSGATLFFIDFISGFGICDSEDILIENLNIDYVGNYHMELEIESVFFSTEYG